MTAVQAVIALENRDRVQAGEGEDHDTGWIHELRWDGDRLMARVGWDSCQESECDVDGLELCDS